MSELSSALGADPPASQSCELVRDRKTLIDLMSCIVLTGFVVAVVYHYVVGMFGGHVLTNIQISTGGSESVRTYPMIYVGQQYPANTFLFRPWDMFNDFANQYVLFTNPEWIRSQPFRWNHFPFAFVVQLPYFYLLRPVVGIVVRELFIVVPFLAISAMQLKDDSRFSTFRNTIIFSVCTYPVLFALDRANNEADIFLLVCWFMFLLKERKYAWSVVPLSLAMAFKPYAAVFLPLLVIEQVSPQTLLATFRTGGVSTGISALVRACGAAVSALLLALVLNLVSIPILANTVSYNPYVLPAAWKQTVDLYVIGDEGLPFSNSLWALLKIVLSNLDAGLYEGALRGLMSPYRTTVLVLFIMTCIYAWTCESVFWKRVALFVLSLNLFPYVSGDYKLLHLFVPIWLFINAKEREPLDFTYAVLFALLLVPKNYARFVTPGSAEANLGVVLNPLLMLALGVIIVGSGLRRCGSSGPPRTPWTPLATDS